MTVYRYTAESWDEFVHDLRTRKINWADGGSESVGRVDWSGCETWEDALEYAVKGHPAGRAAIESAAVKVTMEPEPMWDTAPVGAFPCIPANAAGVPEDMFAMSDIAPPVQSPIVRIAVNMSANCHVDAQDIVNRGVAIVSLIDRIQLSGRRVELIAIKHGNDFRSNDKFVWSVTVKRPEEPIDMDRVGLCFATPIMLRRFFFRVLEFMTPSVVDSYGVSTHFADECRDCDLAIPNISGDEYSTPERAVQTVMKLWQRAAAAA
jgi:hypothetical protein